MRDLSVLPQNLALQGGDSEARRSPRRPLSTAAGRGLENRQIPTAMRAQEFGRNQFSSARSLASSTRLNLRIVGANMLRMTPRLRRLIRTRSCERCGSNLRLERHRKYDSFWIIFLVWLGTAFTFYVVGLLLIGAGLWLWPRRTARWVCPSCTLASPAVSGA